MTRISVITGDLIDSTRVADTAAFRAQLDTVLAAMSKNYSATVATYRGDGFQLALDENVNPFQVALLLRTGLIAHSPDNANRWDARVAIGLGAVDQPDKNQNSPAFVESGRALDAMRKDHLRAVTDNDKEAVRLALDVCCRFADDILNNLTAVEAEMLYYYLLDRGSHQSIADKLGKQRPTVTIALQRAKYKLLGQFADDMNRIVRLTD